MNKQRTILEIAGALALFALGAVFGYWLRGARIGKTIPKEHCTNKEIDKDAEGITTGW